MKEFKFVGVPVHGPEEDYLLTFDGNSVSMTNLLYEDGAKRITWQEASAFESSSDDDHFSSYRNDYIELYGKVPSVYKIKLTVEVEELSKEDSQKFWNARCQQNES